MKKYLFVFCCLTLFAYWYSLSQPVSNSEALPLSPSKAVSGKSIPRNPRDVRLKTHKGETFTVHGVDTSLADPDRDYLMWRKISPEAEAAWSLELYELIKYFDRENAINVFEQYQKARAEFLSTKETTLVDQLDEISRLNGESIEEKNKYSNDEMDQDIFVTEIRSIFRQNYGLVESERKKFLDSQSAMD